MKKTFFLLILACFTILLVNSASATTNCYNWSPFPDVIKVTVTPQDPLNPINKIITGALYVQGLYYLPLTGTMVKDADRVHKRFSAHATNNTTFFGGFLDCAMDATLDPSALPIQGPFTITCGGNGGFSNTGTLIKVDCSTLPSPQSSEILSSSAEVGGK
jgi:hypothetical protein